MDIKQRITHTINLFVYDDDEYDNRLILYIKDYDALVADLVALYVDCTTELINLAPQLSLLPHKES